MNWHTAYIALGSNVGDRQGTVVRAVDLLIRTPGVMLVDLSHLVETDPVDVPPDDDGSAPGAFINGVVAVRTTLAPGDLLDRCRSIETQLGRPDAGARQKNASRTIDLDLLLYDDLVLTDPAGPIVPHPRLHERDFVLRPLAELAPDAVHPILGLTVGELWKNWSPPPVSPI